MILTYQFPTRQIPRYSYDWDEDITDEYEYYVTEEDFVEYFKEYGKEEFVERAVEAWNSLSEKSKQFYLDPEHGYAENPALVAGDTFNWEAVFEDEEALPSIAEEIVSRGPEMKYIMKDWCEEKAEKEFNKLDFDYD